MWQNKQVFFALLFEATAAALLEVAANPKRIGALGRLWRKEKTQGFFP
jgi:hypothetical protein